MLGAMLVAEAAIDPVIADVHLRAEDFYRESHRAIFRAIIALNEKNEAVDPLTVCTELRGARRAREGGRQAVRAPARHRPCPRPATLATTASWSRSRRCCASCSASRTRSRPRSSERKGEPQHLIEHAERRLFDVAHAETTGDFRSIEEVLHEHLDALERLSRDGQSMTGTPSGFRDIDDITGGFQKSNLIVLAARPSMGKSALVANIAENVAVKYEPRGRAVLARDVGDRARPALHRQPGPHVGRQAAQGPGRPQRLAAR